MKAIWAAATLAFLSACASKTPSDVPPAGAGAAQGIGVKYATLKTDKGVIVIKLLGDKAPKAVANFIGLATGAKPWRDPRDGQMKNGAPLYDGVVFHRVIPGFMIQTGDPLGDGRGNVGFTIDDEFDPSLRYDKPGMVGMASIGKNAADSQFFITLAPTPQLNGQHTLFGVVVSGLDAAEAIAAVPRNTEDGSDRPLAPVVLRSVAISDRP